MRKLIIVGFSGKAFSGKSTVAKAVREAFKQYAPDLKVEIVPLAQRLKEQAYNLGWNGAKDQAGRQLLQELSKPIKNYHGEDCYAMWCLEEAECLDLDVLLIDDVRMMPEVRYLFGGNLTSIFYDVFDTYLVRVERANVDDVSNLTEAQKADVSETELDHYPFHYIIPNDGDMTQLKAEAERLVDRILTGELDKIKGV